MALTMSAVAIHAMPNPAPDVVMRNSNADLYDDFVHVGTFATAFVGQYLAQERTIVYANAGHSPVIYRPADGAPRLLAADNTALGIRAASDWLSRHLALRPGDLLVVATDGFSDVCGPGDELFGNERLLRSVEGLADRSAREIADGLFDEVRRFRSNGPQDDDETIVVIKGTAE